jgi:tripartite-type tricarboxylate transporter receptor subunit TctC
MKKMAGPGAAAAGLLLAATFASSGMDAALAQEWEPEFFQGKLQPLPDGFPKGPITLLAAGDRSSAAGLLAVRLTEYSRLFTPVPIEVVNRPDLAGGNWQALKEAIEAEGGSEGYVNVIFMTPDDIIAAQTTSVKKDTGVGPDDLAEVISIEDHRYVVVQCKQAGWEPTWEALVQQIKDNPGAVRYAGGESGDRLDMRFAFYINAAGLGSLYDDGVIKFANTGDVAARANAVGNCDADVSVIDLDQLITQKADEKVDVVLVTGHKRLPKFKQVQTGVDAGFEGDPMSRTMQVVVPAGVDPLHVKWLHTLWWKTGRDSYFKAQRVLDQALNVSNLRDPEESAALNDDISDRLGAVTSELGINVE